MDEATVFAEALKESRRRRREEWSLYDRVRYRVWSWWTDSVVVPADVRLSAFVCMIFGHRDLVWWPPRSRVDDLFEAAFDSGRHQEKVCPRCLGYPEGEDVETRPYPS